MPGTESPPPGIDTPKHRYTASLAGEIEARWQDRWDDEGTFEAPNPAGPLAEADKVGGRAKLFVLDMFPYPSGAGLHVGHPLGYIATDVYGRYKRMTGHNVLHTMGFDAFGLPAEQHAVQTGIHPRVNTEQNIATYRRQLRRLGLAHDPRRSIATTDVGYYRWTQWIFLQIFNVLVRRRRRPGPPHRGAGRRAGAAACGPRPAGRPWASLDPLEQRRLVDDHRLAYLADAAGELVPRPGHRAGQRGGHRRRPQRGRQLPRLQAQPAAVDDAHHGLRRPPDRRSRPAGLARPDQDDAAQLDRPVRGRVHRLPRAGDERAHPGVHHPPGHAVRRHLHGAGPRAPAGRRPRARGVAERPAGPRAGRAARRRRPVPSPPTGARSAPPATSSARSRAGPRPASSSARTASTR